ncbi:hypothetical protein GDO78_005834 [Eleutherodactylus coqui]|uniref:Uncharacterized protein n=1 Tax=Eleutherodactylus coqui TaxID=57060 RepID=A0A8J6FLS8_ELECQ|nr:hypothetical protein GDO78_005834 [Eleutherodactylus coqui]
MDFPLCNDSFLIPQTVESQYLINAYRNGGMTQICLVQVNISGWICRNYFNFQCSNSAQLLFAPPSTHEDPYPIPCDNCCVYLLFM